ncbi:Serine/arginine-rich SC35-like splicing factor SCL30A [Hibiscus syriacus]|uniref:Serine/arginine-rich SC35-like splicing factor SCL30A n=1 Tax=Hibiscus syriacus TaxID=106335 RepID=A0A6A3CWT7_HIBSY|nr:Serine/arginine-rich SC35-like splicing factor SCL30A [Hibiscus syriacus]
MRGRSYIPSPPTGYGRRGRSPSPRGRYGGRARDLPTSLLVRNLRHDCRPEDFRRPFERFGPFKDIYLPKDYYTGEPRGFGFVQYVDPADATEANYKMDGRVLLGRELTIVFAEENRKKPIEMRHRERASLSACLWDAKEVDIVKGEGPLLDTRSFLYSHSLPSLGRYRSRSNDYSPPNDSHYSRSVSPQEVRYSRERYSRSPPPYNGSRNRCRSLDRGQGPSQGRRHSPRRSRSRSPREVGSPVRSRSRSPYHEEYKREQNGERTRSQ